MNEHPLRLSAVAAAPIMACLLALSLSTNRVAASTLLDPDPENSTTRFGYCIAVTGDLDADGIADLAVGAPFQDGDFVNIDPTYGKPQNVGKVFLISGSTLSVIRQLNDPQFQMIQKLKFGGQFGSSIAAVADVNGDGVTDILVGVPHYSIDAGAADVINAGRVFLFSGKDGSVLLTLDDPAPAEGARFGFAVAGLGDVNGDGLPDLLVGVPKKDASEELPDVGMAYVFSSRDGSLIRSLDPPSQGGGEANGRFGSAVAEAGDVTGDGVSDILIGAPGDSRVFVLSGATGTVIFTILSPVTERLASFGFAVAGGKDLDGDGKPDFAIGAPLANGLKGAAYIFNGSDGSLQRRLRGPAQNFAKFGSTVALSADSTGDGRPDILVGAPDQTLNGLLNAGEAFIFKGSNGRLVKSITSAQPKAFAGFASALGAGEFNGNGALETVTGAPFETADIIQGHDLVTHPQIGQIEIQ